MVVVEHGTHARGISQRYKVKLESLGSRRLS